MLQKKTFTTKFVMNAETYSVVVTAVEITSVHLSKRKLRGDLTQNYTNYTYKTEVLNLKNEDIKTSLAGI